MALGETAELLVLLRLKNEMGGGVAQAEGQIVGLNRAVGNAGTGMARTAAQAGIMGRATTGMGQALSHAKGVMGGVVSTVGLLGGTFAAFAGAAGIGAAVKSAMTFQQEMELIRTQAGATQGEVNRMTKAVMDMAPAVAVGPESLARGLYHIESVGLRGARALDVLHAAAQGSRVGLADMESVTNALAAAAYSEIKGVQNMSEAMGALDAIVGAGNMRMQDLADAMGTGILASGRAAGLSLKDVGAALAVLTDQGVPAVVAATRLRMSFALLQAPSSKAQDQLKAIGIGATQLANDMRKPNGLLVALTDLHDHLLKTGQISKTTGELTTAGAATVLRAFGGGRTGTSIVTLLDSLGKLQAKYKIITEQTGLWGDKVAATAETSAFKFAKFQASLSKLGIQLGDVLLPVFTDLADAGTSFLSNDGAALIGGLRAAGSAAKVLFDMISGAVGALSKLPGGTQAMEALLGGAIIGKGSSLLFGKNPFTFLISSVLSRFGIGGKAGGALGGAAGVAGGAVPVYVTNMPAGFGGGGLPGTATGAAEGTATGLAAEGLSGAGLVGLFGGAAGLAVLAAAFVAAAVPLVTTQRTGQGGHWANPGGRGNNVWVPDGTLPPPNPAFAGAKASITGPDMPAVFRGLDSQTPWLREEVRYLKLIAASHQVDVKGTHKVVKDLLARQGGSVQTLRGAIDTAKKEQAAAIKAGNADAARKIGQDIHRLQARYDAVVHAHMAQELAQSQRLLATMQAGFGAVVGAIGALPGLPANAGDQPSRRNRKSGSPITAPDQNRGVPGVQVHINVKATTTHRDNTTASVLHQRFGGTPATVGAI